MVLVVVSDLEDVPMVQGALMVALDDLDRIDFDDFGDELIVEIFSFDVHFGQDALLLLLDVAVAEVELFVGLELELNYSDGAFVIRDSKIFISKPIRKYGYKPYWAYVVIIWDEYYLGRSVSSLHMTS